MMEGRTSLERFQVCYNACYNWEMSDQLPCWGTPRTATQPN
jgi:hypothetical protein